MSMTDRALYYQFAWAYDLIIDKPVAEWCEFIQATLRRHGIAEGAHILDAGCGTGEYAVQLNAKGYRVSGVDSSTEMIGQARLKALQRGQDVSFSFENLLNSDITNCYDVVLCRGVLNDIISDSDRKTVLSNLAKRLYKDGLLFLDVRDWERSMVTKRANPAFFKRTQTERGDLSFKSVTELDSKSHELHITESMTLENAHGVRTTECKVVMRCWTMDELNRALAQVGFKTVKYYGDYCESVPVGTTDRIVTVARLASSTKL
jgi:SAM-dependent methyltransferase